MSELTWPLTFLQLDLPAVSRPQSVFPLLLSRRRVLVFSGSPSDDARLLDPEFVDLQDVNEATYWNCPSIFCFLMIYDSLWPARAHLSARLGAYEPRDGAEVIVVRPDENPEQRGFRSAPVHCFRLAGQLHLHRSLTSRVSFCTHKISSLETFRLQDIK